MYLKTYSTSLSGIADQKYNKLKKERIMDEPKSLDMQPIPNIKMTNKREEIAWWLLPFFYFIWRARGEKKNDHVKSKTRTEKYFFWA